jgi:peroxiredoxin
MPFLQQIYEDRESEGVMLLTINLRETNSKVTQYMQNNNLSFPVLFDKDGSVGLDYNVSGIPTTYLIDGDGIIQAKKLGSFSSIAEIESYISKIQPKDD